jgi:hypothetical protein
MRGYRRINDRRSLALIIHSWSEDNIPVFVGSISRLYFRKMYLLLLLGMEHQSTASKLFLLSRFPQAEKVDSKWKVACVGK